MLAATVYRDIRRSVIESGYELTAAACVVIGLERLDMQATEADIDRGVEHLMRATLHDLAPIAGALNLIDDLRQAGVRLGIVSSAVYHPFLEWSLEAFGVAGFLHQRRYLRQRRLTTNRAPRSTCMR